MAGNGFHVSTDELRSHASSIEGIAGDVDLAAEAAAEKRMGGNIYGVLFDFIIQHTLNEWAGHLQGSLTDEGELGKKIADGVRTNADIYDMAEDDTNKTVQKSGEGH